MVDLLHSGDNGEHPSAIHKYGGRDVSVEARLSRHMWKQRHHPLPFRDWSRMQRQRILQSCLQQHEAILGVLQFGSARVLLREEGSPTAAGRVPFELLHQHCDSRRNDHQPDRQPLQLLQPLQQAGGCWVWE